MYRIIALLFALIFTVPATAAPRGKTQPVKVEPPSYAIWNVDQDSLIKAANEDLVRPMASITKLMSAYVTITGGLDQDEELVVVGKEGSLKIRQGMKLSRYQLIELALVSSDNLAARTLAETYPGGYSEFIDAMNQTAADLGMTNTKYIDATGLLAENISSTDDIRKLVLAASPLGLVNMAANAVKIEVKATVVKKNKAAPVIVQGSNTNYFAGKLDLIAAKTGYTSKAGRCLTMLFSQGGTKYLLVILGAQSNEQRRKMVEQLIDTIK